MLSSSAKHHQLAYFLFSLFSPKAYSGKAITQIVGWERQGETDLQYTHSCKAPWTECGAHPCIPGFRPLAASLLCLTSSLLSNMYYSITQQAQISGTNNVLSFACN